MRDRVQVTSRLLGQQARARTWRVLGRWTVLGRAVFRHVWRRQCVDECTRLGRRITLARGVPVGCPALRACRAVRLLQSTWRLVPYRRDAACARSAVLVQRVMRRRRLHWVSRVAHVALREAAATAAAAAAAAVTAAVAAAAAAAAAVAAARPADVCVCAACGTVCGDEASFVHHCLGEEHVRRAGSRGFAGCRPNAVGLIPALSDGFFARVAAGAAAASAATPPPETQPPELLPVQSGAPSDPALLSARMRWASAMAPALASAVRARLASVEARASRVEAAWACSPRTMERWRVGQCSGRVLYYDTVSEASQWAHPMSGSAAPPLVAVADEVVARCMWPPIGSAWEVAVAVSGGVCYRHTDTDAVQWAPPPGSLVEPEGRVYKDLQNSSIYCCNT